jgi:hypothetical protein
VLGPPLTSQELDEWQRHWPRHPLPADLRGLLLRTNGIHLWADLETGRSYQGLAPLAEGTTFARVATGAAEGGPSDPSDRYLALTYHADNSAFATLDVDAGRYFLMDSMGPDQTCPIADCAAALLDWLWDVRIP